MYFLTEETHIFCGHCCVSERQSCDWGCSKSSLIMVFSAVVHHEDSSDGMSFMAPWESVWIAATSWLWLGPPTFIIHDHWALRIQSVVTWHETPSEHCKEQHSSVLIILHDMADFKTCNQYVLPRQFLQVQIAAACKMPAGLNAFFISPLFLTEVKSASRYIPVCTTFAPFFCVEIALL